MQPILYRLYHTVYIVISILYTLYYIGLCYIGLYYIGYIIQSILYRGHPMLPYIIKPKLSCVVTIVVDSILLHAECKPNDHRKDALQFIIQAIYSLYYIVYIIQDILSQIIAHSDFNIDRGVRTLPLSSHDMAPICTF